MSVSNEVAVLNPEMTLGGVPLQEVLLGVEWRTKLDPGKARMEVLDRGTTALSFPDEQPHRNTKDKNRPRL